MRDPDRPLVSIGVPVHNGAAHLRFALEALLGQTYRDIELLISDNASTDETSDICQEFMARDPRVRYSRNERNIGATENFAHVLTLASGSLFMWAAHDDLWEREYVEANVAELSRDPTVIASISRVEFLGANSWLWKTLWAPMGTRPLMSSVRQNVLRVLWNPGTNSRVYAIFRTAVLRRCGGFTSSWGSDTAFVIRSLRHGKYAEVPRPLMQRRRGMSMSMRRFVWTHNRGWLGRILPFWETTREICREDHVPKSLLVFLLLFKLNALHTAYYYVVCLRDAWTWIHARIRGQAR